ncbi:hypothetical protein ID850_01305 [Xenorhabdus sp. Flor]|uniref:hypothetical protein n=1 Tax=Xenorhabdus cabanillasii TaxID=351673 RepID=UPI0019C4446D|nr:hypothetical protein [Xenorhabdus sp. Flor]MBD2813424.1 hypothetical protein [Xenorhabdus sp. Flor]
MWYICAPLEADTVSLMTMKVVSSYPLWPTGQSPNGEHVSHWVGVLRFLLRRIPCNKIYPDHGAHCARV